MEKKKTLVLGASTNPSRYSYLAINKLLRYGHPVVGIGRDVGNVNGVEITKETPAMDDIDTVTLYLNPKNQEPYHDYILSLKPKRVIFNPGTENDDLEIKLKENGIEPVIACTLVMLSVGQY